MRQEPNSMNARSEEITESLLFTPLCPSGGSFRAADPEGDPKEHIGGRAGPQRPAPPIIQPWGYRKQHKCAGVAKSRIVKGYAFHYLWFGATVMSCGCCTTQNNMKGICSHLPLTVDCDTSYRFFFGGTGLPSPATKSST